MGTVFTKDGVVKTFTSLLVTLWPEEGFEVGRSVKITGTSKGKGFTGVMKGWGFSGGPATHGQSDRKRAPGSIGQQTPGRVFKGKKMAGRKGNKVVTILGSKILEVNDKGKSIKVLGPIPGHYGSKILIKLN